MRRWVGWTLALGAVAGLIVLGTLWRREPRIEPIEPTALVKLSERERVEWLVAQILARSHSKTIEWRILNLLGYGWTRSGYELDIVAIATLSEACRKYDLDRWMRRLPAYVMNDSFQSVLLMHQAIWHLEQGELRAAEAIIQRIPQGDDRETALALFAAAQARKGDHAGARGTLKQLPAGFMISFHPQRQRALEALLQAGMLEEGARLCIEASLPDLESSDAPRSVLDAYRRAGRWGDALNWARQLPPEWREFSLTEWAAHALQQGDPDPTRRLNAQEQTPALLLRLAHTAQGRNMLQQANRWRTEALQRLKSLPARERDLLLHSAAIELARMGDYERAESLIKQIKPGDSLRSWTARQAAYSALEQGNLNRAQRFASLIDAHNIRIRVYAHIAARYYQAGEKRIAQGLIDRIVQQMQPQRHTGLVNYAVDMTDGVCHPVIEEDAYPLVRPLLRQLEEEVAKAPSADARKFMLNGVLSCYTKAGDLERAFHLAAQQRTHKERAEALLAILHGYAWER